MPAVCVIEQVACTQAGAWAQARTHLHTPMFFTYALLRVFKGANNEDQSGFIAQYNWLCTSHVADNPVLVARALAEAGCEPKAAVEVNGGGRTAATVHVHASGARALLNNSRVLAVVLQPEPDPVWQSGAGAELRDMCFRCSRSCTDIRCSYFCCTTACDAGDAE